MARNQISKNDLLVIKVLESDRDFIFSFLVEDDLESPCVIIDFKACAHGLLNLIGDSSYDDDLNKEVK